MRNWKTSPATLIVLGAALTLIASTTVAGASVARHTLTETARVVARPVSWAARVTSGYSVSIERNSSVDCSSPSPSPAAVDRDILYCSPNAEYAVACWLSRTPHRVLCLRDARVKRLVSIYRPGPMPQALPYQVRAPLDMVLGNGTLCTLRAGGAGASLQGHPDWAAFYYCTRNQAVWAPMNARNWGVDRSHPVWTVKTARSDGTGPITTRSVARAWFVGMHS